MKTILITIAAALVTFLSSAQLRGSGKTVTKAYDFKNFDKITFEDLDGKIEVEIGKPFSINVIIDDNLENLFSITENASDHLLTVSFINNKNNWKYIEDTNFKIRITMPKASEILHTGNSILKVNAIAGESFRFENSGNATSYLSGSVTNLMVKNTGNGNTKAENLETQKAEIKCSGNGNVNVNVAEFIIASATGNSSVKNIGRAKFDGASSKNGNARLIQ